MKNDTLIIIQIIVKITFPKLNNYSFLTLVEFLLFVL